MSDVGLSIRYTRWMLISVETVLILSAIILQESEAKLTGWTSDLDVTEGENVTLSCTTNTRRKLRLLYRGVGSSDGLVTLFSGFKMNLSFGAENRYTVADEVGRCTLHIRSIRLADAGTFTCQETGSLETASMQLTVIDAHPTCETKTNSDQKDVVVSCNLNFAGSEFPMIVCQQNNEQVKTNTDIHAGDVDSHHKVITSQSFLTSKQASNVGLLRCAIMRRKSRIYEWTVTKLQQNNNAHLLAVTGVILIVILVSIMTGLRLKQYHTKGMFCKTTTAREYDGPYTITLLNTTDDSGTNFQSNYNKKMTFWSVRRSQVYDKLWIVLGRVQEFVGRVGSEKK